jgi:aerobic-type carbon monoxide dehydrogenase small subunit (CoxS/CutS family)
MELAVNGVTHVTARPPLTSLLRVLREECNVLSPKAGCLQGACGTCTVLVDGEPRRACLVPIATVAGAQITTVEGLGAPGDLSPLQAAFHERCAAQCGYCTSGMLMAAQALLAGSGGRVEREQVIEALAGHICRCTGYVKVVDAVMAASRGEAHVAELDAMPVPAGAEHEIEVRGARA